MSISRPMISIAAHAKTVATNSLAIAWATARVARAADDPVIPAPSHCAPFERAGERDPRDLFADRWGASQALPYFLETRADALALPNIAGRSWEDAARYYFARCRTWSTPGSVDDVLHVARPATAA